MDSHQDTLVADCRAADPNSTIPADDAARPSSEPNPSPKANGNAAEVDAQTSKIIEPRKSLAREKKAKKKRRHRKSKVVVPPIHADADSNTTGSSDSDSSTDSSSSSESDSEDERGSSRGKGKKKRGRKKKKDTERNISMSEWLSGKPAASSNTAFKKSRKDASSKSVDNSSSSDSSSSDDGRKSNNKGKNEDDQQTLKKELRMLQLEVSRLQTQLTHGSQPMAGFAPGYAFSGNLTMNQFPGGYPPMAPGYGAPSMPLFQAPPPPPPPPPPTSDHPLPPRGAIRPRRDLGGKPVKNNTQSEDDSEVDRGSSSAKRKKGMRAEYKRVDWVWDTSLYTFKLQDTAETTSESHYNDYIFHVRRTFDCEGKYRETFVDIRSKLLRECLQDVIGNVRGVSLVDGIPKLDPNLLFLYLEEFREHLRQLKDLEPAGENRRERKKNQVRIDTKRKHLKVLVKYLDKDYARVKDSLYPMLENGLITFDMLWALWKPNTLAYAQTYGSADVPRVFRVESADRQASIMKGNFYYVDGKYFEFDGKRFGYGSMSEEIGEFTGARKITSLPCYPLQYHKDENRVRRDLIERGKKFVSLSGVSYKSYSGVAYFKKKKNVIVKFNVRDSRVMVDPGIFRRINPNYYVSLVRPKDHDILSDDDECGDSDPCGSQDESEGQEQVKYVTKAFRTPNGKVCFAQIPKDEAEDDTNGVRLDNHPSNANGQSSNGDKPDDGTGDDDFTDEDYLIASPVVLGFSFSEKQWLEFTVSGIKEIKWNDTAWDSLVLEDETKDLIRALVESRKFNAAKTIDDVIQGKGKGLVTVLHGPPGTGKTLTAEGISELLKCPLYMASAGELSTDSRYLEAELQKILDICHAWGAILLLDEADVFLEKRNMHDLHRNALVSIFLRQLEYFQGILFLTTNRVETFDEAFQSRIHIALRYENLDFEAKKSIFTMFIQRVRDMGTIEVADISDHDMSVLARNELNGREIKNAVCSAQDLAVSKKEPLSMRHILHVLGVHAKFGRDLKGGQGYEDAMRSYF